MYQLLNTTPKKKIFCKKFINYDVNVTQTLFFITLVNNFFLLKLIVILAFFLFIPPQVLH